MKEGFINFLFLVLGSGIGVTVMSLVQAGKEADKQMKEWRNGGMKNEFWSKSLSVVFIKCTELSIDGNCSNWYIFRL